ncbi:endolytic transglycosylase MltG [Neisseriaceae bacterium TC5R-5]|nr:endolytic transglycosylase MltG [Neisseriaceae bacterium TC5R-5]
MKILLRLLALSLLLATLWLGWVLVVPVNLPPTGYQLLVSPKYSLHQVARVLAKDGVIRNRYVLVILARLRTQDRKVKAGLYRFEGSVSMLAILKRLNDGHPDQASVTVIEGWRFKQFRQEVERHPDIQASARSWSDTQIMQQLGLSSSQAEGMFFPTTYLFVPGSNDIALYQQAANAMQQQLNTAWETRDSDLPYSVPYDLLIMASLIEKETAHEADRGMVASVFVNRLRQGMRLQTDPTVIYGMGELYQGNISKADLRRDTPYNTYTRAGLPPTPIALPGRAALEAAAKPTPSSALYFVAKGGGRSQFSNNLEEHNQAVRKYILKKGKP